MLGYYTQMCKARLFSKQVVTVTKVPSEGTPSNGVWSLGSMVSTVVGESALRVWERMQICKKGKYSPEKIPNNVKKIYRTLA